MLGDLAREPVGAEPLNGFLQLVHPLGALPLVITAHRGRSCKRVGCVLEPLDGVFFEFSEAHNAPREPESDQMHLVRGTTVRCSNFADFSFHDARIPFTPVAPTNPSAVALQRQTLDVLDPYLIRHSVPLPLTAHTHLPRKD